MKPAVVVSLGGSVLYSGEKFDYAKAKALCSVFEKSAGKLNLVVVVGGGALAQKRVERARAKGASEFHSDKIAIGATRENAKRVAKQLKNGVFIRRFNEASPLLKKGRIPVSGGMMPGITTDAVAVLFAEMLGAKRVVNVSKAAGVYDSNPSKNPKARKFSKMSHDELVGLAMRFDSRRARENFVFDVVACKLAARSKIPLYFVSSDSKELSNALEGRNTKGTVVS
ncbi:MAG: UMP kinase [Candidatus Norongarragalinales archaeon]